MSSGSQTSGELGGKSNPAPWEQWELDSRFFTALSRWTLDNPETKLDRVFDKVCNAIDLGREFLEIIPDAPFPARGLVKALAHVIILGNALRSARGEVQSFAKEVIRWVSEVRSAFESSRWTSTGPGHFTKLTWKNLGRMRDLIEEICLWASKRLADKRWSFTYIKSNLLINKEISEFKTRITDTREIFRDRSVITLSWGMDALLQRIKALLEDQDQIKKTLQKIKATQDEHLRHIIGKLDAQTETQARRAYVTEILGPHAVKNASYVAQGKAPCDKDTRIEVLKEIVDWVEDISPTSQNFFWLTGDPGCGKSAITASIARICKDRDCLWAQFFINRNNYNTTNPNAYFPSIARQFATRSEEVEREIYNSLKAKPSLVDSASSEQAASLFVGVIGVASRADPLKPVVVIIDGLDETDRIHLKSTADIFSELFTTLSDFPNTKVFISSRTEDDIRNPFARTLTNTHVKHLHLDTSSESSISDVSRFLRRKIEAIVRDNELDWREWPGDERMDLLAARASGLFVWAVTVAKFIQEQIDSWGKECLDVLLDKLNSDGMTDINNLYGLILELSYKKLEDLWAFECFRRIVGTIVVLQEPMCIDDLSSFLNLRRTPTSPLVDIVKFMKRLRTVLVTGTAAVDGQTIPRLHKSFYEYITDDNRVDKPFHVSMPDSHREISLRCLYQLATAHSVINSSSLPGMFSYATKFWSSHLAYMSETSSGMALVKTSMTPTQFRRILQLSTNEARSGPVFLQYSPSKSLVRASHDSHVRLWRVNAGERGGHSPTMRGHEHSVRAAKYSPDGSFVLSCSWDTKISLWDPEEGSTILPNFEGHADLVHSVDISPNGQYIVSGSQDKTVVVWNVQAGRRFGLPFKGHTDAVTSVAFSPLGDEVISGSVDRSIRRWNLHDPSLINVPMIGHTSWVSAVTYSPDGTTIASCSGDCTIRLWNAKTSEAIGSPLFGHTKAVTTIAYSSDGARFISGSADMTIRFWDTWLGTQSGPPLWGHTGGVLCIEFSPNGKYFASSSSDSTIRLWNSDKREMIGSPMTGHSDWVRSVSFSPKGDEIVSTSDDQTIRIWHIPTVDLFGATFTSISPRGFQTLSVSLDRTVRFWDSKSDNLVGSSLSSGVENIFSVAFSPDGTRVAAASVESISIWDTTDGKLISYVPQPDIVSVDFEDNTNDLLVTHNTDRYTVLKEVNGQFQSIPAQDQRKRESTSRSTSDSGEVEGLQWSDMRWYPSTDPDVGLSAYVGGHIVRAKKDGWVIVVPVDTE